MTEKTDEKIEELIDQRVKEIRKEFEQEKEQIKKEARKEARKEIEKAKPNSNKVADNSKLSNNISRRDFLKKAGLGTAGLAALMSPVSALNVRSDSFNVFTQQNQENPHFSVNQESLVNIQDADLDLNNNDVLNVSKISAEALDVAPTLKIPLLNTDPSSPENRQIWINEEEEKVKVAVEGNIHTIKMTEMITVDDFEWGGPVSNRYNLVDDGGEGLDFYDIGEHEHNLRGRYSMKIGKDSTTGTESIISDPGDGLNYYPEIGDEVRWWVYPMEANSRPGAGIFMNSNGSRNDGVAIAISCARNKLKLNADGNYWVEEIDQTFNEGRWYLIRMATEYDGEDVNLKYAVYEGDTVNDTRLITSSVTFSSPNFEGDNGILWWDSYDMERSIYDRMEAIKGKGISF